MGALSPRLRAARRHRQGGHSPRSLRHHGYQRNHRCATSCSSPSTKSTPKAALLGKQIVPVIDGSAARTGPPLPKNPSSCSSSRQGRGDLRLLDFRQPQVPAFRPSKKTTSCSTIPCNKRVRKKVRTCSIPPKPLISRPPSPAVGNYFIAQGKKKFYLIGTDYVYPQTTNLVLLEYLRSKGVPLENIGGGFKKDSSGKIISAGKYTPVRLTRITSRSSLKLRISPPAATLVWSARSTATPIRRSSRRIRGRRPHRRHLPRWSPISIAEDEFRSLPAKDLVGQLGCWTYFQSINTPANKAFLDEFPSLVENHHGRRRRQGRPRGRFPDGAEL